MIELYFNGFRVVPLNPQHWPRLRAQIFLARAFIIGLGIFDFRAQIQYACIIKNLELERAQLFRAQGGLGLWVSESAQAGALHNLASIPSGFGNFCSSLILGLTHQQY